MPNPKKPLLALDPGLRELGYAVLDGERLVASGVSPLRLTPARKRVSEGQRMVRQLLKLHKPATVVLEATARHPRPGLNRVHLFAQSIRRLARRHGLAVACYSAQIVRKHLVGDGWASKEEVAATIARRYPTLRIYLTQDRQWKERYWQNMFDAVALGLHHQGHPPSRSRLCG
jgi:Holliday junction resolvasome RuvABC endonuclease subunit